ncbi:unnamed protein product [Timema podura]|uniref:Secreted protein n=1 Tax=Timema podura TaxID=61482 RepID=A0ABN7PSJ8_TIMPD|nr:unnamed protein product [Timema podura]
MVGLLVLAVVLSVAYLYLRKPANRSQLRSKLSSLCPGRRHEGFFQYSRNTLLVVVREQWGVQLLFVRRKTRMAGEMSCNIVKPPHALSRLILSNKQKISFSCVDVKHKCWL